MLTIESGSGRGGRNKDHRGWGIDPLALLSVAVLVALGELNLVAIGDVGLAVHQLIAVLGGMALLVVLLRIRAASLPLLGWAAYAGAVLLLLVVLARGRGAYGAQRWLTIGPFDLQPSELAKLGVLLLLAYLVGERPVGWRRALVAIGAAAVPIVLTLRQPDLSTGTVREFSRQQCSLAERFGDLLGGRT